MLVRNFVECPSIGICLMFFSYDDTRVIGFVGGNATEVTATLKKKLVSSTLLTSNVSIFHIKQFSIYLQTPTECPTVQFILTLIAWS